VIIVQVNVLKPDIRITKGPYPDPGWKNVSKPVNDFFISDDAILLSLKFSLRKTKNDHKVNLNRLFRSLHKYATLLEITNWTAKSQSQISNICVCTLKFVISNAEILSRTIFITLLMQNIESNPGMKNNNTLSVLTFNCNGLRDKRKLKRLILKVTPIIDKGGVILLQETHLTDTNYLKSIFKHKFESNCLKTNSSGVITLYNNNYELVETNKDLEGRLLSIVIKDNVNNFIVSNAYYPNDHKIGITFAEQMYLNILELQNKYPEFLTIAAGDYNVCMSPKDMMNRNSPKIETYLAETISNNNKITNLVDAFRAIIKEGGYTWNRGSCYSRLDYIFISTPLLARLESAKCIRNFETSDHSAVCITLIDINAPVKGPGIIKVNSNILDDPNIARQIENEISELVNQTDDSWNPHDKLEFFKVAIRSIFSSKVAEIRKKSNVELEELEEEINQLEDLKLNIIRKIDMNLQDSKSRIAKIDNAIASLKNKLLQKRND